MSILDESLRGRLRGEVDGGGVSGAEEYGLPVGGLSYIKGSTKEPLKELTIPQVFAETVAKYGPREAICLYDKKLRYSWNDLDRDVSSLAAGFLALGLEKGDRVGIWSPNRYEWVLVQFATAKIGVILVNINPAYKRSELEYALNRVSCKFLVTAVKFKKSDYIGQLRDLFPELATSELGNLRASRAPNLKGIIRMGSERTEGMFSFEDIMKMGGPSQYLRLENIEKSLLPTDPVNIQFTSGTTGSPKGALLSHRNIVNNAHFVTRACGITSDDKLCLPVPLYHCFGMVMGTLGCVTKGACVVFSGEGFDAGEVLKAVDDEKCTVLYGVPTMFVALLEHEDFKQYSFSSLRKGIMAGAPCPIEVMRHVMGDMNMSDMTIAYGMTETSPVSFQSGVDDTIERRVTTVGRVHPHVEAKLVDEEGNTVEVGKQGELCTRGYSVMLSYWDDEEKTRDSIVDGWMKTGDLAIIDEEGYCNIVGRVKDMIIRGGENIYPREIEEFLFKHPRVADVQVFGVPDERLGEEVCVWIESTDGEEIPLSEIKDFCKGEIAHYKVPRYAKTVESFPLTVTGKPQKFVMRDMMVEELGLTVTDTA